MGPYRKKNYNLLFRLRGGWRFPVSPRLTNRTLAAHLRSLSQPPPPHRILGHHLCQTQTLGVTNICPPVSQPISGRRPDL